MTNNLVKTDEIQQILNETGFDVEKELTDLDSAGYSFEIPRIRIEHKDNGKHRMYIDYGENYLNDESQEETIDGNILNAVIFAEQNIRALWSEGEQLPSCSGIDETPAVSEPLSDACISCKEAVIGSGKCKPKVRLWLLMEHEDQIKPFVFSLSPTSIKHWNQHKRKLKRSNIPVVAVNTVFKLEDTKKNGYRWAEVVLDVDGVASKEMLLTAKHAREELDKIMHDITQRDYDDPGDKQ